MMMNVWNRAPNFKIRPWWQNVIYVARVLISHTCIDRRYHPSSKPVGHALSTSSATLTLRQPGTKPSRAATSTLGEHLSTARRTLNARQRSLRVTWSWHYHVTPHVITSTTTTVVLQFWRAFPTHELKNDAKYLSKQIVIVNCQCKLQPY